MTAKNNKIKVTLIKGINKKLESHKACIHGLGLFHIGQTVEVKNTPEIRGMINKVNYLLKAEKI